MVEITEMTAEGDVNMTLPVREALQYLKEKRDVYIYVDGEMTRADDLDVRLTSDEQSVDVTLPLRGGARTHIVAPVDDADAFGIADKIGGVWVYNTRKRRPTFAQVKKFALISATGEELFSKYV